MTATDRPPNRGEFEVTLLGPGYGESIVLHVGEGAWVVVDSCLGTDGTPLALRYLESIGLDPARAVSLVVATHWHDDHMRGLTQMIETCGKAAFCCASVFCQKEFLAAVDALEGRHLSVAGSGFRELHGVFTQLVKAGSKPTVAIANRRIYRHGVCEIWSLSPDDSHFHSFLKTIGALLPEQGEGKKRIPGLSPNEVAVVLWIRAGDVTVLLGSDLEQHCWIDILQGTQRPDGRASMFKVPHHGSKSADEPDVWQLLLDPDPFALLTPWRRGNGVLPQRRDVQRILSYTKNVYSTARSDSTGQPHKVRSAAVEKTIRSAGVRLRQMVTAPNAVRLRRPFGTGARWGVEKFGTACHLEDFLKR